MGNFIDIFDDVDGEKYLIPLYYYLLPIITYLLL